MVKYQRKNLYNLTKRSKESLVLSGEDEESCLDSLGLIHGKSGFSYKMAKPKLLFIIFLSFVSCSLVLAFQLLSSDSLLRKCFFSCWVSPKMEAFFVFLGVYCFAVVCFADSFGFNRGTLDSQICSSVPNGEFLDYQFFLYVNVCSGCVCKKDSFLFISELLH